MPKKLFGDATPELGAFYMAAETIAPGAWALLDALLNSWQPMAKTHDWKMPDGFDVHIPVMANKEIRLEVDELDHATFTTYYKVNEGTKKGLSNAANLVHSCDGFIVREMHRRCNYNPDILEYVDQCLESELISRSLYGQPAAREVDQFMDSKIAYYIEQYNRSGMPSAVILPHLSQSNVTCLSQKHLKALSKIVNSMLAYSSFELITVHDEFSAHPNNLNHVRQNYINILAEMAEAEILTDLLSQIHGQKGHYPKLCNNLGDQIRDSAYALC